MTSSLVAAKEFRDDAAVAAKNGTEDVFAFVLSGFCKGLVKHCDSSRVVPHTKEAFLLPGLTSRKKWRARLIKSSLTFKKQLPATVFPTSYCR